MFAGLLRFRSWRIPVILSAVRVTREQGSRSRGRQRAWPRTKFGGVENPNPAFSAVANLDALWGKRNVFVPSCSRRITLPGSRPGFGRWDPSSPSISLPALTRLDRIDRSSGAPGFSSDAFFLSPQKPCPSAFPAEFSHYRTSASDVQSLQSLEFTTPSPGAPGSTAPVPVHPPVDALHSFENAPHTIPNFLLTLKIEGVKTQSFFGTFKVFPVGVASGAQAKSPFASQDASGRASEGL